MGRYPKLGRATRPPPARPVHAAPIHSGGCEQRLSTARPAQCTRSAATAEGGSGGSGRRASCGVGSLREGSEKGPRRGPEARRVGGECFSPLPLLPLLPLLLLPLLLTTTHYYYYY